MKFNQSNFMASLLAACLWSTPAFAEDASSFIASTDTSFSIQYLKTRAAGKNDKLHRVAVYKVLDIDKAPVMTQQIMPGDMIEVTYLQDKHRAQVKPTSPLPWAELKSDGMLGVHIPNKYLKRLKNTTLETVWTIDNSDNRLIILKPAITKRRVWR